MSGFRTILVANRGEIACRVMRTAAAMGYRNAAVYSEADADALHVRMADVAACIGPPDVRESYLNVDAIMTAARRIGAEAVHPGYGFLSENALFARACAEAGLVLIGPSPDAIAAMGNKAEAKRRMIEARVPCVPGYQGSDQSDARLIEEAERIGFPVMVKAAAGGGGRGMRLAPTWSELAGSIVIARAEAEGAFGSRELILEKAIADARHVEVQVLADAHGNVIHLGERDCSAQRRHQKVIEETPSLAVTEELRQRMGAAAVAAASAIGYTNAGTVEFLLAGDGAFYFLEMNTRLQVEHPVTEMVTGLDLVELQIRIARGELLPIRQEDVRLDGHAIEARLYAEAPHKRFRPQAGTLAAWRPPLGVGIRVDHGLREGQEVSPYYDPLLAKIIAHGRNRDEARQRLIQALEETVALGTATNRGFLIDALGHPEMARGTATTHFIPTHYARIEQPQADIGVLALAAALWFETSAREHGHDPARAWSSSGAIPWPVRLETDGVPADLTVSVLGPRRYRVAGAATASDIEMADAGADSYGTVWFRLDGAERRAVYAFADETLHLKVGSLDLAVRETLYAPRAPAGTAGAETEVRAPMNGKVVAVLVAEGEAIEHGQRLVVVEAMKMQHELTAGASGTVSRLAVKLGDQVVTRQLLVELKLAG
ncbi:MAG TPA: biotin carboxylase N-terminal domain-containing protein [Hyphomicrobiaceae bacterium]|jgi:geranyl-CoA carboxylase alpha subunit|nr:biotin carboxylase N-terminal domain-containing protein [Hyphomicrobiaceae bacterium]